MMISARRFAVAKPSFKGKKNTSLKKQPRHHFPRLPDISKNISLNQRLRRSRYVNLNSVPKNEQHWPTFKSETSLKPNDSKATGV